MNDKHLVLKLLSAEEIVATLIEENDYEVKVLFPMLVKYIPKFVEGRVLESITLAPYTYFAADDAFTFSKNQIIFIKELDPKMVNSYNVAVDDFINYGTDANSESGAPQNTAELQETIDKLKNLFRKHIEDEDTNSMVILDAPTTIQ